MLSYNNNQKEKIMLKKSLFLISMLVASCTFAQEGRADQYCELRCGTGVGLRCHQSPKDTCACRSNADAQFQTCIGNVIAKHGNNSQAECQAIVSNYHNCINQNGGGPVLRARALCKTKHFSTVQEVIECLTSQTTQQQQNAYISARGICQRQIKVPGGDMKNCMNFQSRLESAEQQCKNIHTNTYNAC